MKACPVCGGTNIKYDLIDVCGDCGWAEDLFQEAYPYEKGENIVSLNEARREWEKKHRD